MIADNSNTKSLFHLYTCGYGSIHACDCDSQCEYVYETIVLKFSWTRYDLALAQSAAVVKGTSCQLHQLMLYG